MLMDKGTKIARMPNETKPHPPTDAGVSEAVTEAGKQLANVAYNICQQGWPVDVPILASLREAYQAWDIAIVASRLATPAGDGVPPGMVLVPRSPSMAMLNAAVDHTGAGSGMDWNGLSPQSLFKRAWFAMLSTASTAGKG